VASGGCAGSLIQRRKKMSDEQIIYNIRVWLILNIRNYADEGLIEDNKLLLKAIRNWRQET